MSELNKLDDAKLEEVTGGAEAVGSYGFNADGSVKFTDKSGNVTTFSAQQWQTLKNNWQYTGNPEYYISTVPLADLQKVCRDKGVLF